MPTNVFELDSLLCRRKVIALAGKILVYDSGDNLVAFSKQKMMKLKEDIGVYADEEQTELLLKIKARQVMDISATYDVTAADGGPIGALKRKGLKSIVKDQWLILGQGDMEIGSIEEDSTAKALLRRFVPLMNIVLAQTYVVTMEGQHVATFTRNVNPFVSKLGVSYTRGQRALDRRLGLAASVLLLLIEEKQD
ncbi:MAG: hypothetical protein GY906_17585 [bacterium]|nr:hypothetical protein [bacterium]